MILCSLAAFALTQQVVMLKPGLSPVDNPLKGLVPYADVREDPFPHSMEFSYLPLNSVVVGCNKYDWTAMENLLNDVASRGHQTVFRVFLEYPREKSGIPQYLLDGGLKVTKWSSSEAATDPAQGLGDNITPDYSDPNLRQCLKGFIYTLGKKYDGDPRIAFITMGLLGSWGEWHTWPKSELFASVAVQNEVMDRFERDFKKTPVLMRYPRGAGDVGNAMNSQRPFGYHDDSFAWGTLDTGNKDLDWYFMAAMRKAGALQKWTGHPIGGEIRPEAWGHCFDPKPEKPDIQDFEKCVRATHVSWLMDSGMFSADIEVTETRKARAMQMVRLMGYDFFVSKAQIQKGAGAIVLAVSIENKGVAPFYAKWPMEMALADTKGQILARTSSELGLDGILPGAKVDRYFSTSIAALKGRTVDVFIRCENPLPGGHDVGFANEYPANGKKGWLKVASTSL